MPAKKIPAWIIWRAGKNQCRGVELLSCSGFFCGDRIRKRGPASSLSIVITIMYMRKNMFSCFLSVAVACL